jgi:hypothetical protein
MRPFPELLLAGGVLAFSGAAMAHQADVTGVWCADDDNGVLFVEPDGIGLGEHTVCDVDRSLEGLAEYSAKLNCSSFYYEGEKVVEAFTRTIDLEIRLRDDGRLSLRTDNETEPSLWTRCK